jgi:hypothetical protein
MEKWVCHEQSVQEKKNIISVEEERKIRVLD